MPLARRSGGSSRVYVDAAGFAPVIRYGPMYFGMSFRARPLGNDRLAVDKYASFPIAKSGSSP